MGSPENLGPDTEATFNNAPKLTAADSALSSRATEAAVGEDTAADKPRGVIGRWFDRHEEGTMMLASLLMLVGGSALANKLYSPATEGDGETVVVPEVREWELDPVEEVDEHMNADEELELIPKEGTETISETAAATHKAADTITVAYSTTAEGLQDIKGTVTVKKTAAAEAAPATAPAASNVRADGPKN